MIKLNIIFFIMCVFSWLPAFSQSSAEMNNNNQYLTSNVSDSNNIATTHRLKEPLLIELYEGTEFEGYVEKETPDFLFFRTLDSVLIQINKKEIENLEGDFKFQNYIEIQLYDSTIIRGFIEKETFDSVYFKTWDSINYIINKDDVQKMIGDYQFHKYVKIQIVDSSIYTGYIEEETYDSLYLNTDMGIILSFCQDSIIDITDNWQWSTIARGAKGKEYWKKDPNQNRLFFAPSGRSTKAGHGYLKFLLILPLYISAGITDFISLGLGWGPWSFNGHDNLIYLNLKYTPIEQDNYAISVGFIQMGVIDYEEISFRLNDNGMIPYGCATIGDNNRSVTEGLGVLSTIGKNGDYIAYPLYFGGDLRLSNGIKLLSENWLAPDFYASANGIRFFSEYFAFEIALGLSNDGIFPWLMCTINF